MRLFMSSPYRRFLVAGVLTIVATSLAFALPVTAVTVGGGWTRSDVGLHNEEDGFYLSVANTIPWNNAIFDAVYSLDYVQKKGSQPTLFVDPTTGFTTADAAVTLHVLEPSLFMGARIPGLSVTPRVYVGGSLGLKVNESWSDFPGEPNQEYGYKDTDAIVHVGASLGIGPVTLDVRWSKSAVGQLLYDNQNQPLFQPEKAEEPLPGVKVPEEGYKTEVLRVGVSYSF